MFTKSQCEYNIAYIGNFPQPTKLERMINFQEVVSVFVKKKKKWMDNS